MRFAITCGFLIFIVITQAQNLVVNPGFEECKKGGTVVPYNTFATCLVKGWQLPTAGTPDWYCDLPPAQNPLKRDELGTSVIKIGPHSGYAYAGFIGFSRDPLGGPYSEYPRGTLSAPLIAGHTYTASFWIAQSQKSDLKTDTLGICLFNNKFEMDSSSCQITMKPQARFIVDTSKTWQLIQCEFIADGTEKYFLIGNFATDFDRSGRFYTKSRQSWHNAYYFIDDVSIIEKDPNAISIVAGQKLTFNNILFETGKAALLATSYSTLDKIVNALKNQSTLKVEIAGHTDSDGTPASNQTLSEQRALAVKQYFISKGIDSTRITTIGYGSTKPISSDKTKNRRVEFYFSE